MPDKNLHVRTGDGGHIYGQHVEDGSDCFGTVCEGCGCCMHCVEKYCPCPSDTCGCSDA